MAIPIATRFQQNQQRFLMASDMPQAAIDHIMEQLAVAVVVDIQNVSDQWQTSGLSDQTFDLARTPWQSALFEFSRGEVSHGVAVMSRTPDDHGVVPHTCLFFNLLQYPDPVLAGAGMFKTDPQGRILRDEGEGISISPFFPAEGVSADQEEQYREILIVNLGIVIGAIAFANCKNVEHVEEANLYPSRQARRAAERRGETKPPRFYTLRINPNATRKQGELSGAGSGRQLSLHIVRGHFSTYTEERKLFGKHAGTFWVPSHVRGSDEVGIVGKDYEILSADLSPE